MTEIGIYIGRFCPPHIGHNRIIQKLLSDCGTANSLVIIGSSNNPVSYRHLFPIGDRAEMLRMLYPMLNVVGLPDHGDDESWLADMWLTIECWRHGRESASERSFTFYGGCEEDVLLFVKAGYNVNIVSRFDGSGPKVSATEVRDALVHGRGLGGLVPDLIRGLVATKFRQRWEELKQR